MGADMLNKHASVAVVGKFGEVLLNVAIPAHMSLEGCGDYDNVTCASTRFNTRFPFAVR